MALNGCVDCGCCHLNYRSHHDEQHSPSRTSVHGSNCEHGPKVDRKKEQSIKCIHKQHRKMNDNANAISSLEDTEAILSQMWTGAHEEINNIDPGELKLT
jgi:predicted  nucleic acid-binding Zn-ribbon protein